MADIEFSEMVCHSAGDTKQEGKGQRRREHKEGPVGIK